MPSKTIAHPDQGGLALRGGSFTPEIQRRATWRPPDMATLPDWRAKGVKLLGLDTETKDSDLQLLGPGVRRPGNFMCGISFAFDETAKWYLPFAHEGGDNLPRENVMAYIKDQFKHYDGDVVGANLPYDLDWLWQEGVAMPVVRRFKDVQVADPLLYELHKSYSLAAICERWGIEGKNEDALREAARQYKIDPKRDLWRLPARHVGAYGEDDAVRPLQLLAKQEAQIRDEGIEACWDMECRTLPVLLRMQRRGVRVNEDRLAQIEEWTRVREAQHWAVVKEHTGVEIPIGHSMDVDLLSKALRAAGLDHCIGETERDGKSSVTKDTLAHEKHPVALAITKARQVSTLRTTFVNGTRAHIVNGRIHCTFNQIRKTDEEGDSAGVAYGRLSASHPNMQNQPGNSRFSGDNEVGPMWRSIYMGEDGEDWTACDLKQQEPKWSFHYSAILEERGVSGVRGALDLCARLTADPTLDTYEPIVQIAGVPRPTAKITWLARAYGQGDGTLCEALGYPTIPVIYSRSVWGPVPLDSEEGQRVLKEGFMTPYKGAGPEGRAIIDKFDEGMPFLKTAANLAKKRANENGFVMLLSKRRCHFEKKLGGGYNWTHKAFNRIIQGTAAEQTKLIMLAVCDAGYDDVLHLQVHDELDFSLPRDGGAKAQEIAEVMRHAVPMKVPTVVDVEAGPSWGESMGVEYKDKDGKKAKTTYKWGMQIVDGEVIYKGSIL